MEKLLQRGKIDYIRHLKTIPNEVSLETIERFTFTEEPTESTSFENFEFENESLSAAFSSLTRKQKEVLKLIFLESLNSEEAAKRLGCSVENIYNLRSLALKALKRQMEEGRNRKG